MYSKSYPKKVSGNFDTSSYFNDMLNHPEMIRIVAFVGHLHHGKTKLIDMLIATFRELSWDVNVNVRFSPSLVVVVKIVL